MTEESVVCPKCGARIPLTRALVASIEERFSKEFDSKLEKELKSRLTKQATTLKGEMQEEFDSKMREMQDKLEVKEKSLKDTKDHESSLRRELLETKEKLDNQKLEMERQLEEDRKKMSEDMRKKLDDEFNLKNREVQQTNESLKKQVEELKQKLEQGSQQMQGEVFEQEIQSQLTQAFPSDSIAPVPPGTKGPDILQTVRTPTGRNCGVIAWEIKNTKDWKEDWIAKLKGELTRDGAELGVIVSKALPPNVKTFVIRDGIVVASHESAIPISSLLRTHLIEVERQRSLGANSTEIKDQVYHYLTSTQFRQRVESMVEPILQMKKDLDRERRSLEGLWSKRIKQMEMAVNGIAGMYNDLAAIVGQSLPAVKELSLPEGVEESEVDN